MAKTADGWLVSSHGSGDFAAAVPIWPFDKRDWGGTVETKFRVTKGKVGVSVLTADTKALNEQYFDADPGARDISLPASSAQNANMILFRGVASGQCEVLVQSADLVLSGTKLTDALSLDKIVSVQPSVAIEHTTPLRVVTTGGAYTYAAMLPLALDNSPGLILVRAKGKVVRGEVGFGILNKDQKAFQTQQLISANGPGVVFLLVSSPSTAGSVIIENGSKNEVSEVLVDDIAVYTVK